MHTVPLTTALIPAAASANASAFRADELFVWLQPRMHLNPDAIRHNATIKLRQRLNTPGVVVRVAVSDDNDPWWDESVGEEVLGYAVWERLGVQDGKIDEKVWGKDTLWKSELLEPALRRDSMRTRREQGQVLTRRDRIRKKSSTLRTPLRKLPPNRYII